jgi:ACS family hexuronate transporter-like MFS transporter
MGAEVTPARFAVPRLRWLLAGMLLALSVLNYIDRQALSVLAETIQKDLGIDNRQYGLVTQAFLVCYTLMYVPSGWVVDKLGPRRAEALFILWWSGANVLTGWACGLHSLAACRGLLGLGEPGHYAASAKVVAEWFPPREKGIAVGMYVMGGTLGAAVAAPLVVGLTKLGDWRTAFVVTGMFGLVLAAVWWVVYRPPARHPWLGPDEREYLEAEGVLRRGGPPPAVRWRSLLGLRSVWLLLAAKMLTDSVWYFYLFWFAKYLQAERGYTLENVAWTGVVFLAADAGCLLGGLASGWLVRRGLTPPRARLGAMSLAAGVLTLNALMPAVGGMVAPLLLACLIACAIMVWMTNSVTLVIDLLPPGSVGSAQGLIGAGGSLGGALTQGLIAYLVTEYSYDHVFYLLCSLHPAALLLLRRGLPGQRETR